MASEEVVKQMLEGLRDAVVKFDKEKAEYWAKSAIEKGVDLDFVIKEVC